MPTRLASISGNVLAKLSRWRILPTSNPASVLPSNKQSRAGAPVAPRQ